MWYPDINYDDFVDFDDAKDLLEDKVDELEAIIESVHYLEPTTNEQWLMTPQGYIIKYELSNWGVDDYYIEYGVKGVCKYSILKELDDLKKTTWKQTTEHIQKVIALVKIERDQVDLIKKHYHCMKPDYDKSTKNSIVMKTPKGLEICFDIKDEYIDYGDCEAEIMQELREIKSS